MSASTIDAGWTVDRGPYQNVFTLSVPLARPAIVVGLTLALIETLNDFCTVEYFAVNTLTLGIFDVWFNMNRLAGAAQIATSILVFVLNFIVMERYGRRRRSYWFSQKA